MPAASPTETGSATDSNGEPAPGQAIAAGGIPTDDRSRASSLQPRTVEIGRELFDRMGRGPRPWQRAWWEARFMAATRKVTDDAEFKSPQFLFAPAHRS